MLSDPGVKLSNTDGVGRNTQKARKLCCREAMKVLINSSALKEALYTV